jgi:hypothetical protein
LKNLDFSRGNFWEISIPAWLGMHRWIIIAIIWAVMILMLIGIEKNKL